MSISSEMKLIAPREQHTHTIIFLHGRDSDAEEFATDFLESQASDDRTLPEIFPNLKWVFPTAAIRMSERFQVDISQWFDMWTTENPAEREEVQIQGLNESVSSILEVMHQEMNLIRPECIILAGISQGCATAIHALFQSKTRLGGFIGLSSWLPLRERTRATTLKHGGNTVSALNEIRALLLSGPADGELRQTATPLSTPVFLAHSVGDNVVNVDQGEKLRAALEDLGMAVEWHAYDSEEHWITEPQGVDDMVTFMHDIMNRAEVDQSSW